MQERSFIHETKEEGKVSFEETLSAAEYLKQIYGAEAPRLSVQFFSGPHATEMDAEGIEERLKECDVYIPEKVSWNQSHLQMWNDISAGNEMPPESPNPFFSKIYEYLYASEKPVAFIDFPEEEWEKKFLEYQKQLPESLENLSYEEALEFMDRSARLTYQFIQKEREQYMLSRLGPKIVEVLEAHPELKQKKELNILITLGMGHTNIYHQMKKDQEMEVSRDMRYSPSMFGYYDEMMRRYMFGKDLPEALRSKALAQGMFRLSSLQNELVNKIRNTSKTISFERYVIGLFSEDEIKAMFEEWKDAKKRKKEDKKEFLRTTEGSLFRTFATKEEREEFENAFEKWRIRENRAGRDFEALFLARLKEKGLKLPENEAELDEVMKTKKI